MRIVAFVSDLMDRSRISGAIPGAEFTTEPAAAAGADTVVVDLARFGDQIPRIRAATAGRIVAYGPHVDDRALTDARDAGADVVVPRSRFFRDPAAAVTGG